MPNDQLSIEADQSTVRHAVTQDIYQKFLRMYSKKDENEKRNDQESRKQCIKGPLKGNSPLIVGKQGVNRLHGSTIEKELWSVR